MNKKIILSISLIYSSVKREEKIFVLIFDAFAPLLFYKTNIMINFVSNIFNSVEL